MWGSGWEGNRAPFVSLPFVLKLTSDIYSDDKQTIKPLLIFCLAENPAGVSEPKCWIKITETPETHSVSLIQPNGRTCFLFFLMAAHVMKALCVCFAFTVCSLNSAAATDCGSNMSFWLCTPAHFIKIRNNNRVKVLTINVYFSVYTLCEHGWTRSLFIECLSFGTVRLGDPQKCANKETKEVFLQHDLSPFNHVLLQFYHRYSETAYFCSSLNETMFNG